MIDFNARIPFMAAVLAASAACHDANTPGIRHVFVIAMENHNLTQPRDFTAFRQIRGNPAAPFLNSLMTPGNPNAAQTAYASWMLNVARGLHPSEPNYIWEIGGDNFGVATDDPPSEENGNVISAVSMTGLMTQKDITWHNYQEDVEYSTSPLKGASGSGGIAPSAIHVTANRFNGSSQYGYVPKHNPMAFFTDSATANVRTFAQLRSDLAENRVAQYNWITPNDYNDMHSPLRDGFTYDGVRYEGDQASVAQGDNFLATIVPEIMASRAYRDNGVIIIWFDETVGGDSAEYPIPEIVISPLAKGNAYEVTTPLSHSADLRTMEEIFGLGKCLRASCDSPDLSDFFQPGAIPHDRQPLSPVH